MCNSLKGMIRRMTDNNMQVVLTLRAFSMTDLNFLAFNGQTKVGVSHVPMDLRSSANVQYGYSKQYYDFVREVMEAIDHTGYGAETYRRGGGKRANSAANFTRS